jgi:hypothetical protein
MRKTVGLINKTAFAKHPVRAADFRFEEGIYPAPNIISKKQFSLAISAADMNVRATLSGSMYN